MQPNYSSVGQVFSAQTRYVVPLFQRPYVWTKEDQWRPLWDDVRELAERVLNPPAHRTVAGHFLGTVVLEQLPTAAIEMPQRQIIDGQQRLTTLQILLKASEHALMHARSHVLSEEIDRSLELAAGQVGQLSRNTFAQQSEEAYKVWPTNDDRTAFKDVMDSDAEKPTRNTSRMAEAYTFFRSAVEGWLTLGSTGTRGLALSSALKDHLRLIVLDLDDTDEPQAIFETLNAHGTPLLPADLLKNWLLWQAGKQQLDADSLYSTYWSQFDRNHEYWRKEIGKGHAARPRVDLFLQSWLTATIGEAISVKHLYDRFLAYANKRASQLEEAQLDTANLMSDIKRNSDNYRLIDQPAGSTEFAATLTRLNRLDFVVFRPALMKIMERSFSDENDRTASALALESYLVRRMVCDMQTRGYGTLAVELVKRLADADSEQPAAAALVSALRDSPGGWPEDDTFRHNWCTRRFYGWFRRDRVAMILQSLEERLQSRASKSEPVLHFDYSKLTIEHIMPQSWAANWPLPTSISPEERETLIQNIGNLTLVSGKLKPSLSNSPWTSDDGDVCKRRGLEAHSDLKLNKSLLASCGTKWTEDDIRQRAAALFDEAKEIWPSADALATS